MAASLGCLIHSPVSLASPAAIVATLFPNAKVVKVAQCDRLLRSYQDEGRTPERGTPERAHYLECYFLMCGIRLDG